MNPKNKHLEALKKYLDGTVNKEEYAIQMSFQKKDKYEKIKVVCGLVGGVASVEIENKTLYFTLFLNEDSWIPTGVFTNEELFEIKNLIVKL